MYIDGKKALLMIKDPDVKERMKNYLFHRYNLLTESSDDILEVLSRIGSTDSYELVILDESVAGLPPAGHTVINIKDKTFDTNVLFLSTLHELADPYFSSQLDRLPLFMDLTYRLDRANVLMRNKLAMHTPVMKAESMEEVYPIVCKLLVETFEADGSLLVNLRLGEEPVTRAIVAGTHPPDNREKQEFHIKATGQLRDLITYFRPVHVPDLDEVPDFRRELEEKLCIRCRSVLLLPTQLAGKCVGFIGMYMRETPRVFNLTDIDLSQRLADMTAAVLIGIFFKKHLKLKLEPVNKNIMEYDD